MKIFYSWQADTPESIGKSFIRLALDEAATKISENMGLSEADRPIVDQDTQGVMGSPGIVETIFEKIRNSDVVVVDVTLIGETNSGKKLINSNVAYELGFAHGFHDDQVLLTVMNSHYGSPESLPFDLKHRRWPVRFNLSPDATKAQRKDIRKALSKEFYKILKIYLEHHRPMEQYEPTPSTVNAAMYWQDNEALVHQTATDDRDRDLVLGYRSDQPLVYLRIWPNEPLEELSGKELSDYNISEIQPLLGRTGGYSSCRNKYGKITYAGENAGELISITQVLKNREIWGVEGYSLRRRKGRDIDFVPTSVFEKGIILSLNKYLRVAFDRLDYSEIAHLEAGMVNVEGFKLAMPNIYLDRYWGPIFEDMSIQATVNRNDPESIKTALLKIFEAVFDAAGTARPKNHGGFPAES